MHVVVKNLNVRARVAINFWSIPRRSNSATVFCKEKQFTSTSLNKKRSGIFIMADVPLHMGNPRRSSYGSYNGKMSGIESKTPFLIGVSGGTASGKVSLFSHNKIFSFILRTKWHPIIFSLKNKENSQKKNYNLSTLFSIL